MKGEGNFLSFLSPIGASMSLVDHIGFEGGSSCVKNRLAYVTNRAGFQLTHSRRKRISIITSSPGGSVFSPEFKFVGMDIVVQSRDGDRAISISVVENIIFVSAFTREVMSARWAKDRLFLCSVQCVPFLLFWSTTMLSR
jgi:hypothetical protein